MNQPRPHAQFLLAGACMLIAVVVLRSVGRGLQSADASPAPVRATSTSPQQLIGAPTFGSFAENSPPAPTLSNSASRASAVGTAATAWPESATETFSLISTTSEAQRARAENDSSVPAAPFAHPTLTAHCVSPDGYEGDVLFTYLDISSMVFLKDVLSAKVDAIAYQGPLEGMRFTRGPRGRARFPAMTLADADASPELISKEDCTLARRPAAEALCGENLNAMVEVSSGASWSIDISFDRLLVDPLAGDDPFPELLLVSRAQSALAITLQPIDERGAELGPPVAIGGKAAWSPFSPVAQGAVLDHKLRCTGFAELSYQAIDISTLGFSAVARLRVRNIEPGDRFANGESAYQPNATGSESAWGGFKLLALDTRSVPMPEWYMGD